MSEESTEDVTWRLDRLERENRRLKQSGAAALLCLAAVLVMGQAKAPNVPRVLEAERMVLRDRAGMERAVLQITDDDAAELSISNKGRVARIAVSSNGVPSLIVGGISLWDADGKRAVQLYDSHKRVRAALTVFPDEVPRLVLFLGEGVPGVGMAADATTGKSDLTLWDKDRVLMWSARERTAGMWVGWHQPPNSNAATAYGAWPSKGQCEASPEVLAARTATERSGYGYVACLPDTVNLRSKP